MPLLQEVKQQFTSDVEALRSGKCEDWLQQPASALAGIILADQFTRCDLQCAMFHLKLLNSVAQCFAPAFSALHLYVCVLGASQHSPDLTNPEQLAVVWARNHSAHIHQ